jgi:predicted nucleotidyltransferase
VPDPRPHLLNAVLAFVRAARSTPGVLRIALLGSLATDKPAPKDADVLVTIDSAIDLGPLARLARRLQGTAQTVNLGADIFLADAAGRYRGASATTASAAHGWPAARAAAACASTSTTISTSWP